MPEQTEKLLNTFIAAHKAHSVFLLVVPASVAPRTSPMSTSSQSTRSWIRLLGSSPSATPSGKIIKKDV